MLRHAFDKVDIPEDVADALRQELDRVKSLGTKVPSGYRFTKFYWLEDKKEGN